MVSDPADNLALESKDVEVTVADPIPATITFHRITDKLSNPVPGATVDQILAAIDALRDAAGSGTDRSLRQMDDRRGGGAIVGHVGPTDARRMTLSRIKEVVNPAYAVATGRRRAVPLDPTEGLEHQSFITFREDGVLGFLRPSGAPTAKALGNYIRHKVVSDSGYVFIRDIVRGDMQRELARHNKITFAKMRIQSDAAIVLANADLPHSKLANEVLHRAGGDDVTIELRASNSLVRSADRLHTFVKDIFNASADTGAELRTLELKGTDAATGGDSRLNLLSHVLTESVQIEADLDDERMIDSSKAWSKLDEALGSLDERLAA